MQLSNASKKRLEQAHPDLQKVVLRAVKLATAADMDFGVLETLRTVARQKELVRKGASKTMKSRHLAGPDGKSRAVDLGVFVGGSVRWDWPLYHQLAKIVKQAAIDVGVPIEWGGDWKTFKDGPHWQLPWSKYP